MEFLSYRTVIWSDNGYFYAKIRVSHYGFRVSYIFDRHNGLKVCVGMRLRLQTG